ncbi:hypothetical protein RRG08_050899 [Elysia crispata]|uniref:EF-hand domain-containing protein n=1 Tax=Elysia crispata TaxID=231223 RepID=A0AAE0ZSF6_9GAST|nr:hypothetical protein RRG08_050899 [Elysia crispata]
MISASGPSEARRDEYMHTFIQQLINFCETKENLGKNRDCFGLPAICTEKMPGASVCDQFSLRVLSLNEKLWAEARDDDTNGDGVITEAEMEGVLLHRFDADDDSCVSLGEWQARWSSVYHMSPDFGQFYYRELVKKGDCLKVGDMDIPDEGIPVADRPAMMLEVTIKMCDTDTNLYQSLPECAQIADTCLNHFRSLPACKLFLNSCGLAQYVTCVQALTDSACASTVDQWEVSTEAARARNQVKVNCRDESVLASFHVETQNGGSQLVLSDILVCYLLGFICTVWS